ncbi:MAG: class I SAM-dependent methyltransferase [Bacteroidetes bacterium]|nr:MAG: class I SAM-dependent methyltransferase [Bacteroidota bacterium]
MFRLHLFEFEDLPWYPQAIRQGQTDFLRFMMEVFDVFRAVVPRLKAAMQQTGHTRLVDLCSGGGGSMLLVQRALQNAGMQEFSAILSDLYPNLPAFQWVAEQSGGKIGYLPVPVDARQPSGLPEGFRTIFNGFHHFRPAEARRVLLRAVEEGVPIGIFEPLDKSVVQLLLNTLALTLLPWLFTPFIRPFSWSRLLFTYLIPLIPLCTLWDGWVSVLRLYSPAMLEKLVQSLPPNDYSWQIGKAIHPFGRVIYLIGTPAAPK